VAKRNVAFSGLRERQYIIRAMRVWPRIAAAMVLVAAAAGCRNPFGQQYEYEEQLYLGVDGTATMVIDASIPALVALRGLPIDPAAPVDREQVRRLYSATGCGTVRVGQPWFRQGRRFVQISVATADVRDLRTCAPLSWSTYTFDREDTVIHYRQIVGASVAGRLDRVNWDGRELVAFKLHLPSRILFHNVKRLEDGQNGTAERGNILTWEQRLADRRAGVPVDIEIRMQGESILYRTLWLFAGAFAAAMAVVGAIIWVTVRRAKGRTLPGGRQA
jgi:hypothetical protein